MKYKTFTRELGWIGAVSWLVALITLGTQIWDQIADDAKPSLLSWIIIGLMVAIMVGLTVHLHFRIRRHNAKVDEERAREERWLEYMDGPLAK